MFMALMVINTCETVDGGLDSKTLNKMYLNLILDFAIGLVPILGDIADAMYKCNTRNAILLEEYLRKRGQLTLKRQGAHNVVDPSLADTYDMEDDDDIPPPRRNPTRENRNREPARPAPARAPRETRGGGIFGFGGGRHQKEPDIEMGGRDRDRTRRHR